MTLRVLVCIPTFNNPLTIDAVVTSALNETALSVLVVDDGSEQPVGQLLKSQECFAARMSGRLHLIRFAQNLGKGAAIQEAIRFAVKNGFTHLLTVDGDGQHYLSEAAELLKAAQQQPWNLIIGRRRLETSENVPTVSKFGREFSNFWVGYQTGHKVHDSQSGYRLYPLFHLQNWKFWTRKYDFEIEVLIRLIWSGVGITEVEIQVHYPKASERVSHFDKFWDNVRISTLNTILVVVSLLKLHREPKSSGLAMGLGVFIGSTPFFGFHTLILAAVSFLFRLNAGLMFIGSQISLPPLAVFLIPLEITVGRKTLVALGQTPAQFAVPELTFSELIRTMGEHFGQWLLGAAIVGTVLGLSAGLITYFVSRKVSQARKLSWTGRTRGGRFGNGFMKLVLRFLGLRSAYFCLYFIVPYFYIFAPSARQAANEYWRARDPHLNYLSRQQRVMKQLFLFAQILVDRAYQSYSKTPLFTTESHGIGEITGPASAKQPIIVMTGHVGGWDLASSLLGESGLKGRFNFVHYQASELTFEKVVKRGSLDKHIESMVANEEQDLIFRLRELHDRGEPVGLMGDRPTSAHFELVSFLGHLAPIDTRPLRIAAANRTKVVFAFGFKKNRSRYELFANPGKLFQYNAYEPRNRQLRSWAQEYARALETAIAHYPEQWFNFFGFFSQVPIAPFGEPNTRERHSLLQEWSTPVVQKLAMESAPTTNA